MNDLHIGVVDTSYLNSQPACLLAESTMKQWITTDPEKDKLLNQISCGGGKTGADCWNTETYKGVFGPVPDGNRLPNTTPVDGNCIWTNPKDDAKVNIGPVEPKSAQYAGQCIHNIFYCNGNGLCKNKTKGTGKECVCSQGYKPYQDINNCVEFQQKYKCMQTYDANRNSLVMGCQETSDSSGTSLNNCIKYCNEELYKNKALACRSGGYNKSEDYQYCGDCGYFAQNNKCSDKQYGSRNTWEDSDSATITVRHPGVADKTVHIINNDGPSDFAPYIYRPPQPCVFGNLFCLPKGLSKNGGQIEYPIPG